MATLRNLPQESPESLASLITLKENQIISMALSKSDHVQIALFAFADNEDVTEEEYFGDTMYYIIEGEAFITMDGKQIDLKTGDVFSVPAHKLHAISGKGAFKVLHITIKE